MEKLLFYKGFLFSTENSADIYEGKPSESMELSKEAIKDLRIALRKTYGEDFDSELTDQEVCNQGVFILTVIIEKLSLW